MIQLDEDFEDYVENNICNNCNQLDIEQDCPYRYYHECPDVKYHIEQTEKYLKKQDGFIKQVG